MENYYENDVFKTLKEYPKYEINCEGVVRNVKSKRPAYTRVNKQGYRVVQFKVNYKVFTKKIHRLVAENFLPPPSKELVEKCSKEHWNKVCVNHKDANKLNNHVSNLEWCDQPSNNKHALHLNLVPPLKGVMNGRAILTEDLVHKVCKFYEDGGTPKDAVVKFNISRSQSTKIKAGIAWNHIWEQYNIKVRRKKIN